MQANVMSELKRMTALAAALAAAVLMVSWGVGVASARAEFGIEAFDQQVTADPEGDNFTQAGGHPYEITTEIMFNHHEETNGLGGNLPDADTKDTVVELTPGLFGNPAVIPQCTQAQLAGAGATPGLPKFVECPVDSVIGTITLFTPLGEVTQREYAEKPREYNVLSFTEPIYNMVPTVHKPAIFGFAVANVPLLIEGNVRNSGDFGVNLESLNIPAALPINGFKITFWGVPSDHSHDFQRCDEGGFGLQYPSLECEKLTGTFEHARERSPNASTAPPEAFLTMPVACNQEGEGMWTTMRIDSWLNAGQYLSRTMHSHTPPGDPTPESEWGSQIGMTGCDLVPFSPSIRVTPSSKEADTPGGFNVEVALPQEGTLNPVGIAESDIKTVEVDLPPGVSLSPSAAGGLASCTEEEIGLHTGLKPHCPEASTLGTVEVVTPLQEHPLTGKVYLGKQNENPFHTLIALYLVAEGNGVILKLAGKVVLDHSTGQITTIFENTPELPFSNMKMAFNGGSRAPMVDPPRCGTYETTAHVWSWSGGPPVETSSAFKVTSGPDGGPCPEPVPFAPKFQAGSPNIQAGAFSAFTMQMFREDGEQQIGELEIKTPPGLLGTVAHIPLCPEPQASLGECSQASEIGHMSVAAGAGATPVFVNGGKIYLTGSYKNSQFGLTIVQEAVAGPFDLGKVVIRGQITVDPHTASLTINTDPLPTDLDGIPLDLRVVNVSIDRNEFTFNPTNCNPLALTAVLTSGQGAVEDVSSPYQVTNCGVLGFHPHFVVTASGNNTRANGASLDAKIVYPSGPQANIAKVKVDLPKQLPSRLTTLQKACPDKVFEESPSHCPPASVIGVARANTPILPVPLVGPVYFVSHGDEAFPNLIMVLQGYGVRFDMIGNTYITKDGVTTSTFNAVPDVPITSFELFLPQGPDSALAANGQLCKTKLVMPTVFVAQNGLELHQNTPIGVTGCKAAASRRRGHAASHGHKRRHHKRRHKQKGHKASHVNGRGK